MSRKPLFSIFRSTGFVAILLICLVLIVQYAGAWYWLEIIQISKETDLQNHLADLGQTIEPQVADLARELGEKSLQIEEEIGQKSFGIPEDELPILTAYASHLSDIWREPFDDFAKRARLKGLTILDESGRVLLSTSEEEHALTHFDFLELDRDQFEEALAGRTAGSLAYRVRTSPLKRVYIPIFDKGNNTTAAVLCLTAGRDYLGELDHLADNVRILSTISTILVLIIGWLVYRILNRQKNFERQAAHADRLSSLGSLAAGFAHEVRNPLEIIAACTEDLERSLTDGQKAPPEALEACRDIMEEVERVDRLVGQFLQYSKSDAHERDKGIAAVSGCLASALAMLKHAAEKRQITVSGAANLPPDIRVGMSEDSLRQIIVNLVMNAIQSIPDGGRIEVSAEAEAKFVRIRFSDNGPGVAPEIRSRIFDPFFTTRSDGSGLGLSIAHQLAARAGGTLEYEEQAAPGACFVLMVPRQEDESSVPLGVAEAMS